MRFLVGLVVALVELVAAGMFAVNGPNWDWWRVVMYALAVLTIVLVLKRGLRVLRPWLLAGGGFAVAAIAAGIAAQRFNDSYLGSRVWPDILSCVFGAGAAAVEIGVAYRR